MVTRSQFLESLKYVVDNSSYVSLNNEAIHKYVKNFQTTQTTHWSQSYPLRYQPRPTLEKEIDFLFLLGSQAFYYCGFPDKWTIEYKSQKLDGWWAAIACFQRALENKIPLLQGDYLASLTLDETRKIFAGDPEIPFLKERQEIFNKIGNILVSKYQGRFYNFFSEFSKESFVLLNGIAQTFPGFNDRAMYKEREVYFFKKAQLVVNDINHALYIDHPFKIKNINQLTGTADYKIPAMLRHFGILVYNKKLEGLVDNRVEINQGSEMEIEIRANQLWAVQIITSSLEPKYQNITPGIIQDVLWIKSQDKTPQRKPYHLTKTIYY